MHKPLKGVFFNTFGLKYINHCIRIAACVLAMVLAFGCHEPSESENLDTANPEIEIVYSNTIVALGDSLTAGLGVDETQAYPFQLERKLVSNGHRIKVINAGISGETSSGTLSRIHWVISSLKPDYVILVIGANDGMRGIDPGLLRENLDKIISILKKNNIGVLLGGMQMLPNIGPVYAKDFETVYSEIAKKQEILFMPFFLEGVAGEKNLNQGDGIHPTADGYSAIVERIYPYVLKLVGE